jgi:FKBP12-rapamycin complex-associated protein
MVMQAVMFIFNSLGLRCVQFLDYILPHMLMVVRSCNQQTLRESLLQQLAVLSSIKDLGQHLRPFLPEIIGVVTEFWRAHLPAALVLVERMAACVPDDFRAYIPTLVSYLLPSIEARDETSTTTLPDYVQRLTLVLASLRRLKPVLGEYLQVSGVDARAAARPLTHPPQPFHS